MAAPGIPNNPVTPLSFPGAEWHLSTSDNSGSCVVVEPTAASDGARGSSTCVDGFPLPMTTLLERSHQSPSDLANALGVSVGQVDRWCAGEPVPGKKLRVRIVEQCGHAVIDRSNRRIAALAAEHGIDDFSAAVQSDTVYELPVSLVRAASKEMLLAGLDVISMKLAMAKERKCA